MENTEELCIFVGMKQTLPEYIAQNENLRQILLTQEGGIMKYLAEHLDANGTADLFSSYQNHCVDAFFERNKWSYNKVWEGDDMRRAALGMVEHLRKEFNYYVALKPQLTTMTDEVAERIKWFVELYLEYAYKKNRQRCYPNGMTARDVYQEVLGMFNLGSFAYKSMDYILKEHHAKGEIEKTEEDLWMAFKIHQWIEQLTLADFAKMRQAVAEMLAGKDDDQCRQMAADTMERVRGFSQRIYTDAVVEHYRDSGYTKEADQRESDGEWLRDQAYRGTIEAISDHIKTYSMRYYFSVFVSLLKDIGHIWAAQLLVHKKDMRELEKEVVCIMHTENTPRYYVDKRYIDDLPDQYCVSNDWRAKALLKEIGREPAQKYYFKFANENNEEQDKGKLYRAYNVLVEEGFINEKKTKLTTFNEVLVNNVDRTIFWQNDPTRKFLKELIYVFLGISKNYSYPAILAVSDRGKQWAFVKQHFKDENNNEIEIHSNTTKLGKKDQDQFDRILKAIYFMICPARNPKKS